MKEPRILGEIMKEFLLKSDDDFAVAFRKLCEEYGSHFLDQEPEKDDNGDR